MTSLPSGWVTTTPVLRAGTAQTAVAIAKANTKMLNLFMFLSLNFNL
jgi:hypothetical protein